MPRRARVVSVTQLTSTGTYRIRFTVLDDDPFDPLPGQFVAFDLVGHHEYRRSPYCLLGVEGRTFEILVRRVPQGPISQFLVGLRPDDEVGFRGPTGRSMIPRRPGPMVAFATGVGISPCLFLAESLASLPDARLPLRVFWGLRLPDDLCLEEEIARLEARGTLRVTVSLSRPPSDWHGLRGRITETVPPLLSEVADTWFYLVSNGRMVAEMRAALEEIGVDRNRIYCESFFDHRHRPDPDTVAEIVARFPPAARTGLATLSLLTGRGRDLLSRP